METYLADETRTVTAHDGRRHTITLFHLHWMVFDTMCGSEVTTEADLVRLAEERAQCQSLPFDEAFRVNLAILDHELRLPDEGR